MDRPEKLRRVSQARATLPYMSQTALAAFLKLAKDDGLPQVTRRDDIREARNMMTRTATPFGPIHQTMRVGDKHVIEVAAPAAVLWHCSALPAMQPLWERAMAFPQPWNIIFYGDEIGAGNALAHVQTRKSWAIYWTIAEFGAAALACEDRGVGGGKHRCNAIVTNAQFCALLQQRADRAIVDSAATPNRVPIDKRFDYIMIVLFSVRAASGVETGLVAS